MKKLIIISIFSLFIFSCDENKTEFIYGCTDPESCTYDSNVNVYVPNSCNYLNDCGQCTESGDNLTCFNEFVFPLSIGNNWIYNGYSIVLDNDNDTIQYCSIVDTITVDSIYNQIDSIYRLNIKSHYDCDETGLWDVEDPDGSNQNIDQNIEFNQNIYLKNDDDGLYYYGSEGLGSNIIWSHNYFESLNEYSLLSSPFLDILSINNSREILDVPRLSIKYPVIKDDQWEYINDPFTINRQVSEVNEESFTLESIYSFDLNVFHKYSNIGMIHYRTESEVESTTSDFPDGTGEILRIIDNYELIQSTIF